MVNRYLVDELDQLGLWNPEIFDKIVYFEGSVQNIEEIPLEMKSRYKTVYELDWKALIDMNADRAPFISQTASFNHYTSHQDASPTTFTQKAIYAWRKKLKTISYYMHTETASTAKKEMSGMKNYANYSGKNENQANQTVEEKVIINNGRIERGECGDACQI